MHQNLRTAFRHSIEKRSLKKIEQCDIVQPDWSKYYSIVPEKKVLVQKDGSTEWEYAGETSLYQRRLVVVRQRQI